MVPLIAVQTINEPHGADCFLPGLEEMGARAPTALRPASKGTVMAGSNKFERAIHDRHTTRV